jgi:hypothetical protein
MDFFPSAEKGGGVETFGQAYLLRLVHTLYRACIYNNMVHLATNMLSKDVFDKASFNEVNISSK